MHMDLFTEAGLMRIVLVGPGIMPIPPTGWGAVEILIWDTKNALEALGHEVKIVNTKDGRQILDEINLSDLTLFMFIMMSLFLSFLISNIPVQSQVTLDILSDLKCSMGM